MSDLFITICLSRVWLQPELDDTKSYYQLIIKITISEKKKTSQVLKIGENSHQNTDKGGVNILRLPAKTQKQARARTRNYNLVDLNYIIFEYDWLIELSDNKLFNEKLLKVSMNIKNVQTFRAEPFICVKKLNWQWALLHRWRALPETFVHFLMFTDTFQVKSKCL